MERCDFKGSILYYTKFCFSWADIDPDRIEVKQEEETRYHPYWDLLISTRGDEEMITYYEQKLEVGNSDIRAPEIREDMWNIRKGDCAVIHFSSKNLAERVAKAFRFIISNCNKSAF